MARITINISFLQATTLYGVFRSPNNALYVSPTATWVLPMYDERGDPMRQSSSAAGLAAGHMRLNEIRRVGCPTTSGLDQCGWDCHIGSKKQDKD